MHGRVLLMLFAGLAFAVVVSGCAQLESTREYLMMNNRKDDTEEYSDDWSAVGREGRGNEPVEIEPDGWFDRMFHSKKYREINRNLGFRSE